MKRSEMLKLIESIIDAGRDYYDNATRSDNLLSQLEQAGMLPPTNKEKSFKLLDNGEMVYQVNEWEPE